jgi:RNase P/RNase MRP subunit p30
MCDVITIEGGHEKVSFLATRKNGVDIIYDYYDERDIPR